MYLNLDQVNGLHESWLCGEHRGIQNSTGCGNDLTTTSMDGISVKSDIMNVKTDSPHVLLTECTLVR